MLICRKCGNELGRDDLFCNKCGSKIDPEKTIPDLSLKESIELVEILIEKYTELKNLENDIADCEEKLSRSSCLPRRGTSMMDYFWKFILATLVAVQVSFVFWFVSGLRSTFPWSVVCDCFYISIPIGNFIFGLVYSIRKSRAVNQGIAEWIMEDQNRRIKLRNHLSELKLRLDELKPDIQNCDYNIPEEYRSAHYMSQIKTLLLAEKASSLYGAIALLRK